MIALLSPAKSLDFDKKFSLQSSKTRFNVETNQLIEVLRKQSEEEIKSLMSISDQLAQLNVERYQAYKKRLPQHAKQAALAFQGDVYQGMKAEEFTLAEHAYAQDHIRILSGLYGLLRPLDLIQPYRLEMGTKLQVGDNATLYAFWDEKITKLLVKDLKLQEDNVIINLASNEYFKVINKKYLKNKAQIIDIDFKDFNNGKYKIVSFYAKKARGMMAKYIVKNKVNTVHDLKAFDHEGYYYDEDNSSDSKLSFKRG
ncbi:MAG: cytoplasmic iron level regulating protein YaaA (DUF328/UPF0246 family) [Marivirga sp.]|jgi:cytoplasmic iron level regulating protein YaaA (DUF328/UPF0246 family)